jgi:DNA-binding response OmpR family regulator
LLRRHGVDLVLLDWALRGEVGVDVLARLRSEGFGGPVMMITAESTTEREIEALEGGATDFVRKPFEFSVLEARIRRHLRNFMDRRDQQTTVGAISISRDTMTAFVSGKPVALSPMEFRMLVRLASTPGTVVSKEDLWEASGGKGSADSVRVVIRRLRGKLGSAGAQIKTQWGRGVVLEEQ